MFQTIFLSTRPADSSRFLSCQGCLPSIILNSGVVLESIVCSLYRGLLNDKILIHPYIFLRCIDSLLVASKKTANFQLQCLESLSELKNLFLKLFMVFFLLLDPAHRRSRPPSSSSPGPFLLDPPGYKLTLF